MDYNARCRRIAASTSVILSAESLPMAGPTMRSFEIVRICWAWALESLDRPASARDSATSKGKIRATLEVMGRNGDSACGPIIGVVAHDQHRAPFVDLGANRGAEVGIRESHHVSWDSPSLSVASQSAASVIEASR